MYYTLIIVLHVEVEESRYLMTCHKLIILLNTRIHYEETIDFMLLELTFLRLVNK